MRALLFGLFGDGAFSLDPGDCGRWPFMSMPEPSRCIWAAIMAGFFICMPAMGLPLLLCVRGGLKVMEEVLGRCVRSVVGEGGALELVGRHAIGHAAAHHGLILGVHGVVHHQALVALFVLHLGEVLWHASVPRRMRAEGGLRGCA